MRQLLEGMGKTLFFRSGNTPLVLSHAQVEARKRGKEYVDKNVCYILLYVLDSHENGLIKDSFVQS